MNRLSERYQHQANSLNQVALKKTANRMSLPAKYDPAEAGNEAWFITLSDLLMLLLIFFVILFGMTLQQQVKPVVATAPQTEQILPVAPAKDQPNVKQPAASPATPDATAALESDLLRVFDAGSDLHGITIARSSQHVVLTFPEQIIFASGQAQLKSSVQPKLEQIAVFIQKHPHLSVEIQGHTDGKPISTRRYPSNWELSSDRATQVAKSLVQMGVNPAKISTRGFGEYHPIYSNDNESDRLKNRRVELQFSLHPAS